MHVIPTSPEKVRGYLKIRGKKQKKGYIKSFFFFQYRDLVFLIFFINEKVYEIHYICIKLEGNESTKDRLESLNGKISCAYVHELNENCCICPVK